MNRTFVFLVLTAVLTVTGRIQAQGTAISEFLPNPNEITPWQTADSIKHYVGEDLFLFIDGGAEVYLEYGFEEVVARTLRNPAGQQVKIEIYAMKDPAAAFGIYSISAGEDGRSIEMGNGGTLHQYYLLFWKDNYLITVVGSDTLDQLQHQLLEFGRLIEGKIPRRGEKPVLSRLLPTDGMQTQFYVRGWIALSSVYLFDTKNIFRFRDGIIGRYKDHTAFLLAYADSLEAKRQCESAQSRLAASGRFSNVRQLPGLLSATDRKGQKMSLHYAQNFILVVITRTADPVKLSSRFLAHLKELRP